MQWPLPVPVQLCGSDLLSSHCWAHLSCASCTLVPVWVVCWLPLGPGVSWMTVSYLVAVLGTGKTVQITQLLPAQQSHPSCTVLRHLCASLLPCNLQVICKAARFLAQQQLLYKSDSGKGCWALLREPLNRLFYLAQSCHKIGFGSKKPGAWCLWCMMLM